MSEHEQVISMVRAKNTAPIELNPRRTALIIVDMQRYLTQPSHPFTEVFEKLSSGSTKGYLKRVGEIIIPNIHKLLVAFRDRRSDPEQAFRRKLRNNGS